MKLTRRIAPTLVAVLMGACVAPLALAAGGGSGGSAGGGGGGGGGSAGVGAGAGGQRRGRGQRLQCFGQCGHSGDTRHTRNAGDGHVACYASHACDAGNAIAAILFFLVHDVCNARDTGSARLQGRQHHDDACGACNAGLEEVRNEVRAGGSGQLPAG